MSMDNRIFRINGSGQDMLLQTLKLAFSQYGPRFNHKTKAFENFQRCSGWSESVEHGLILHWSADAEGVYPFPGGTRLDPEGIIGMVWNWLQTDFAKTVKLEEWCEDADHDGSNSEGWIVYVEDWGHVGGHFTSICAIKPAFLWHGK